jgi:hypothetical protein
MEELFFIVEESADGGFAARALGQSLSTVIATIPNPK